MSDATASGTLTGPAAAPDSAARIATAPRKPWIKGTTVVMVLYLVFLLLPIYWLINMASSHQRPHFMPHLLQPPFPAAGVWSDLRSCRRSDQRAADLLIWARLHNWHRPLQRRPPIATVIVKPGISAQPPSGKQMQAIGQEAFGRIRKSPRSRRDSDP